MAFTKSTDDLNIIQKLDDEPNDASGLTAEQLKAKFDEAGNKLQEFVNKHVEELHAETASESIGIKDKAGNASTVQAVVDADRTEATEKIDLLYEAVNGAISGKGNIPIGGKAGQSIVKNSDKNFDVRWGDVMIPVTSAPTSDTPVWIDPEDFTEDQFYTKYESDNLFEKTAKIGDIKTTIRTDLGDEWLLCNGETIRGEGETEALFDGVEEFVMLAVASIKNQHGQEYSSNSPNVYDFVEVGNFIYVCHRWNSNVYLTKINKTTYEAKNISWAQAANDSSGCFAYDPVNNLVLYASHEKTTITLHIINPNTDEVVNKTFTHTISSTATSGYGSLRLFYDSAHKAYVFAPGAASSVGSFGVYYTENDSFSVIVRDTLNSLLGEYQHKYAVVMDDNKYVLPVQTRETSSDNFTWQLWVYSSPIDTMPAKKVDLFTKELAEVEGSKWNIDGILVENNRLYFATYNVNDTATPKEKKIITLGENYTNSETVLSYMTYKYNSKYIAKRGHYWMFEGNNTGCFDIYDSKKNKVYSNVPFAWSTSTGGTVSFQNKSWVCLPSGAFLTEVYVASSQYSMGIQEMRKKLPTLSDAGVYHYIKAKEAK